AVRGPVHRQLRDLLRHVAQLVQSSRRIHDSMPEYVEAGAVLVSHQDLLPFIDPGFDTLCRRLPGLDTVDVGWFDDSFWQRFVLHSVSCLPTVRDLVRVSRGSTLRAGAISARQRLVTPMRRGDQRLRVRSGSWSAGNTEAGCEIRSAPEVTRSGRIRGPGLRSA